jgi:hypothetical protein
MALTVKFITRQVTERPVLIEPAAVDDLDEAVRLAQERLRDLRYHLNPSPDGFVIEDDEGRVLRKWIDK